MYYDDYMNDFMYFNSNAQNPNNMNYMPINNMNAGFNNMNYTRQPNVENFYPSIYKIIQPVVRRVVAGSNYQYLTEEVLNNMVDTVYSIIDGENSLNQTRNSEIENVQTTDTRRNSSTSTNSNQENSQTRNNQNNKLLKDLIKIMVLQEISRNNIRRNNQSIYQNQYLPYNNMFI